LPPAATVAAVPKGDSPAAPAAVLESRVQVPIAVVEPAKVEQLEIKEASPAPAAEIAEVLNINEGTIHSRLHIGRERLRVELEKQSGFSGV